MVLCSTEGHEVSGYQDRTGQVNTDFPIFYAVRCHVINFISVKLKYNTLVLKEDVANQRMDDRQVLGTIQSHIRSLCLKI